MKKIIATLILLSGVLTAHGQMLNKKTVEVSSDMSSTSFHLSTLITTNFPNNTWSALELNVTVPQGRAATVYVQYGNPVAANMTGSMAVDWGNGEHFYTVNPAYEFRRSFAADTRVIVQPHVSSISGTGGYYGFSVTVHVKYGSPQSDLSIEGFSGDTSKIDEGQSVVLTATIKNIGSAQSEETVLRLDRFKLEIGIADSGTFVDRRNIPRLAPGEQCQIKTTVVPPAGSFNFICSFPKPNGETESASFILTVTERPRTEVTLDPMGGTISSTTVMLPVGSMYGSGLPTPVRVGYTFAGWFLNEFAAMNPDAAEQAGSKLDLTSLVPAYPVKFYAGWRLGIPDVPVLSDISFYTVFDGGAPVLFTTKPRSIIGRYPSMPEVPEIAGYTFSGWYTSMDRTQLVGFFDEVVSTSLYGFYDAQGTEPPIVSEVVVHFHPGEGTLDGSSNEKTYQVGRAYGSFLSASWTGHTFLGWYTDEEFTWQVDESDIALMWETDLYAKWGVEGGGDGDDPIIPAGPTPVSIAITGPSTVNAISVNRYNCIVTMSDGTTQEVKPEWTIIQDGDSADMGRNNDLLVFSIEPYSFSVTLRACYTENGETVETTMTVTIKADEASYVLCSVEFGWWNPDGRWHLFEKRVVTENDTLGSLPVPEREKHTFLGWYTAAEGGTKVTAATKVSADVTYYAHWEYNDSAMVAVKVAKGCELMGKVTGGNARVKAGVKVSLKATANKGYAFSRWEKAGNGEQGTGNGSELLSQAASFSYVATGEPVTIVAVFASSDEDKRSLKVEIEDVAAAADGTIGAGGTLDLGSSVVSLSEPKLAVKGLPAGLKFDAKTGLVSGKATKPGVYTVTVTATNASATGKDAVVKEFTLTVPNLTDGEIPVADGYGPFVPGVEYAETVSAAAGCTVTGLPSGMKWTAKDVVDAKTKAVKVPANSFYGAATKPGSYTVYFTKTVGKAKRTATATFTVGPFLRLAVEMSGNTGKDKATGAGDYAANKKVTLKATPDKGKVFAGWYDAAGEPLAGAADYRTASFPYVTTDADVTLTAAFATEAEDIASLKVNLADDSTASDGTYALDLGPCVESVSIPKLAVKGLPAGLKYDAKTLTISGKATKPGVYAVKVEATNASVKKATTASTGGFTLTVPNFESGKMPELKYATDAYGVLSAGVALNPALIDCTPADGWAVKVAGLPAGLKYDAKTGVISGIPTAKAGSYTVTFTVTKGKEKETATITLNVAALPAWAVGTFDGVVERGTGNGERGTGEVAGLVSLTIDAKGKISGKILEGGQTWTLAAASFSAVEGLPSDVEDLVLRATVVGKAGKAVMTNEIAVAAADGVGVVASESWTAIQNLWKRADTKAAQPVFKKNIDYTFGNGLKLTFKKDGAVAFAGKVGGVNVSGSSQLVWVESGHAGRVTLPDGWSVTLYAPPKGTFDGFCATYAVTLTFENSDSTTVTSVAVSPVDE